MASVNKVILVGNLGRDPETRYTPDGSAITTVSIATTEVWKDKSGEKQEKTEWHRVVFFNRGNYKLGEIAGEYLKKGSQIYVEGKLQLEGAMRQSPMEVNRGGDDRRLRHQESREHGQQESKHVKISL